MNIAPNIFRSATWPRVRLGDIADHRLGKMLDKQKNTGSPRRYLRNPNIRWFDFDLTDLREILVEERDIHRYELRDGDVLICEGGEAGRAAIWKGDGQGIIFQKACHRVRVGPRLDARFLVHRLMFDYFNGGLDDYYTGATIKHFTGQDLARYEIPLPPLHEQKRIAAILDKADQLRQKRRQAIGLLDSLTQSIFLEMFGDPVAGTWPAAKISEIAIDIRTGPFGSQLLHSEFVDSGISVLGIDNAVNNRFEWGKSRFITEDKYRQLSRYTVKPDDVLITIMGTCGRCAVVPDSIPIAINTKHLCCITLDRSRVLPQYLHSCFLNNQAVLRQLGVQAKGAVMPGLNMGIIKSVSIPVPPIAMQLAFKERIAALSEQSIAAAMATDRSDALFASLQHRAFSGQL